MTTSPPEPVLTARSARVKATRQLQAIKHRRATGRFLAEGPQAVRAALASGAAIEVFVDASGGQRCAAEVARAGACGVPVHAVDSHGLASLATTETPQGIVAVCRWQPASMADLLGRSEPGQIAFAHEMADPGNAGALIRVADAAGAHGVVLSARSVDPTNPKCVRASAGSLFHVPVTSAADTLGAIGQMRVAGYRVLAADVTEDSVGLFAAERTGLLGGRIAWVFGNEAHGLPPGVLAAVDHVVRIPILGRAESLNLATAAAVCLYAYARLQGEPR